MLHPASSSYANLLKEKVEEILAKRPALIIIDQIDRYQSAGEILDWLQHLSAPSRALVSMQEDPPGNINCSMYRRLNPLDPQDFPVEYQVFVKEFLHDFPGISEEEMHRTWATVGGNPRKMRMLAVYARTVKGQQVDLQLSDLSLESLVRRTCEVLSDAGRDVLAGLIPFPFHANLERLHHVANPELKSESFHAAVDELINLDLVDAVYVGEGHRVGLRWDDIVRTVAEDMVRTSHHLEELYQRWVEEYCVLAESVGFCPYNHERLRILDPEMDVLPLVIDYVATHKGFEQEAIRLANCTYFYFVRGHWSKRTSPHLVAALAARATGCVDKELFHLSYQVEWLTRRTNFNEIKERDYLIRLRQLSLDERVSTESRVVYLNTYGYYLIEAEEGYAAAEEILLKAIELADTIGSPQKFLAMYHLGFCYAKRPEYAGKALDYLAAAAQESDLHHDYRTGTSMRILLASMMLQRATELPEDRSILPEIRSILDNVKDAITTIEDRTQKARYLQVRGQYERIVGRQGRALRDLQEALAIFHQLARPTLAAEVEKILKTW